MNETDAPSDQESELTELRSRNGALEAALREAQTSADQRAIQAELRNEAIRRGIVDLDGLKLVDASDLAVDAKGEIKGASAMIAKLQRDKPWLFAMINSSSLSPVPPSTVTRNRLATEMSLEEWRAARMELLRRR